MLHLEDIRIRDPFVVPVAEEGAYYLYGTTDPAVWQGRAVGFDAYRSVDLVSWDGPLPVFRAPEGFWATENYWAPEVHRYGGRYYLLGSFKAPGERRGTQFLVADGPRGPFRPLTERPVTPRGWECLDGTLHVEADGQPWMVFCHEWKQVTDGEMCAMPLTADLREAAGEPVVLFRASEAPWVVPVDDAGGYVTDGPFLHRTADGTLAMLWASFASPPAGGPRRYAEGVARSESGLVTGPWRHDPTPLYAEDGGHGMLFRAFDGRLIMPLHAPNRSPDERARLVEIR
jgi:arabinan endo-1,5-alpha-L-arabinosidase